MFIVIENDSKDMKKDPVYVYLRSIKPYLSGLKKVALEKFKGLEAEERLSNRSNYNTSAENKEIYDKFKYIKDVECNLLFSKFFSDKSSSRFFVFIIFLFILFLFYFFLAHHPLLLLLLVIVYWALILCLIVINFHHILFFLVLMTYPVQFFHTLDAFLFHYRLSFSLHQSKWLMLIRILQ
jgi:hypothetical protein